MTSKVFFWLGLTWGLVMVFMIPPFQTPDEDGHYFRAVAMSEGEYWCHESQLKVTMQDVNFAKNMDLDRIRVHPEEKFDWRKLAGYRDTGGLDKVLVTNALCPMSSFTHLHTAGVLFLANRLGANKLQGFYLARIANLLLGLGLIVVAIKISKIGRGILLTLGWLPMTMQQLGSLSYDAMLIPLLWIFSVWTVRMFLTTEIRTRDKWVWVGLFLPVALAKPAYLPMMLAGILGWGWKKVGGRRGWFPIVIGVGLILGALWVQTRLWGSLASLSATKTGLEDKIEMATKMPWVLPAIVIMTILSLGRGWELFLQMLGKLGYLDYYLGFWVYAVAVGMLALGTRTPDAEGKLSRRMKAALWISVGCTIAAIFMSLYFLDTPLSRKVLIVRGVQGRYLLPLMYWVLVALKKGGGGGESKEKVWTTWLAMLGWILLMLGTVAAVMKRYY